MTNTIEREHRSAMHSSSKEYSYASNVRLWGLWKGSKSLSECNDGSPIKIHHPFFGIAELSLKVQQKTSWKFANLDVENSAPNYPAKPNRPAKEVMPKYRRHFSKRVCPNSRWHEQKWQTQALWTQQINLKKTRRFKTVRDQVRSGIYSFDVVGVALTYVHKRDTGGEAVG